MSSDDSRRVGMARFSPAGAGIYPMFRCVKCNKDKGGAGSKRIRFLGARVLICAGCAAKAAS